MILKVFSNLNDSMCQETDTFFSLVFLSAASTSHDQLAKCHLRSHFIRHHTFQWKYLQKSVQGRVFLMLSEHTAWTLSWKK